MVVDREGKSRVDRRAACLQLQHFFCLEQECRIGPMKQSSVRNPKQYAGSIKASQKFSHGFHVRAQIA